VDQDVAAARGPITRSRGSRCGPRVDQRTRPLKSRRPVGRRKKWEFRSHNALLAEHLPTVAVPVSESSVRRILRGARLQPHRQKMWLHSQDEEFRDKRDEILRLYYERPPDEHIICLDEKHGMQALERRSTARGSTRSNSSSRSSSDASSREDPSSPSRTSPTRSPATSSGTTSTASPSAGPSDPAPGTRIRPNFGRRELVHRRRDGINIKGRLLMHHGRHHRDESQRRTMPGTRGHRGTSVGGSRAGATCAADLAERCGGFGS
jgi:hypothetical protein